MASEAIRAAKFRVTTAKNGVAAASKSVDSAKSQVEMAKQMLASAESQLENAKEQFSTSERELKDAKEYLAGVERKWEVIDVDSDDESGEQDIVKGNNAGENKENKVTQRKGHTAQQDQQMQIFVKASNTATLVVRPSDPIRVVKEKCCERGKLRPPPPSPDCLWLAYGGKYLEDLKSLEYYNVSLVFLDDTELHQRVTDSLFGISRESL